MVSIHYFYESLKTLDILCIHNVHQASPQREGGKPGDEAKHIGTLNLIISLGYFLCSCAMPHRLFSSALDSNLHQHPKLFHRLDES